jgi:hypothetical protein
VAFVIGTVREAAHRAIDDQPLYALAFDLTHLLVHQRVGAAAVLLKLLLLRLEHLRQAR